MLCTRILHECYGSLEECPFRAGKVRDQAITETIGAVRMVDQRDHGVKLVFIFNPFSGSFKADKARAMREWFQNYITQLLAAHGGNVSQAARAGGQDPSSLRAMIRKYQIQPQPLERLAA